MRAMQGARRQVPLGPTLLAAGAFCLIAAGGLLWWHRGAAVFEDIVAAAIAWCL